MTSAKRSFEKRIHPSRQPRNLQIERLENRWVMSGASASAALNLTQGAIGQESLSGFIGPLPANQSSVANQAEATGFDRFKSFAEIKDYYMAWAVEQFRGTFGKAYPYSYYGGDYGFICHDGIIGGAELDIVRAATLTNATLSSDCTNVQVEGVDEADLMETDGHYLYVLSGKELVIVDIRTIDSPTIAARVQLNQRISSMYLSGDRLTLISQKWDAFARPISYDGWNAPYSSATEVTVLDVADRTAPKIVQETSFEGYLVDSRAIGDRVYLVFNRSFYCPGPKIVHEDGTPMEQGEHYANVQYRYQTEQEYRQDLSAYLDKYALASFVSHDADGKEIARGLISEPDRVFKPGEADRWQDYTTVAVIDMKSDKPGPADALSITGVSASRVYVSNENIYLLSYAGKFDGFSSCYGTAIHKVSQGGENGKLNLVAMGAVKGQIIDQFSVDEHNGFLRIATTGFESNGWENGISKNHLFVLEQKGKLLEVVGSLNLLADGESIFSARFMGDEAFIVTFRQTDPLFALDLSDPTKPVVKGELELPGFSNYLHKIEGGLLIGVGRNADVATGIFQDPQVSLFDVDDLGNPLLLDRITIPTGRAGGGHAFDDHHVIAYYPESHILTISVPDGEEWRYNENDLYVFHVDTSGAKPQLKMLGKIEHEDSVLRGVQIDDRLISISYGSIEVHDLDHPDQVLAKLKINDPESIPPIWDPIIGFPIGMPIRISPMPIFGIPIIEVATLDVPPLTPTAEKTLPTIDLQPSVAEDLPAEKTAQPPLDKPEESASGEQQAVPDAEDDIPSQNVEDTASYEPTLTPQPLPTSDGTVIYGPMLPPQTLPAGNDLLQNEKIESTVVSDALFESYASPAAGNWLKVKETVAFASADDLFGDSSHDNDHKLHFDSLADESSKHTDTIHAGLLIKNTFMNGLEKANSSWIRGCQASSRLGQDKQNRFEEDLLSLKLSAVR